MYDIFQQPWTLLSLAFIALVAVWIYRAICFDKRKKWQWAIPLVIAVAAIGLDFFVKTDIEKIHRSIKGIAKAVENENSSAIADFISESYKDSYHASKMDLINHSKIILSEPLVEKNITTVNPPEINNDTASSTVLVRTVFDKQSMMYQNFKALQLTQLQFDLKRENNDWLITRIELLKIDNQPVSWSEIRKWAW